MVCPYMKCMDESLYEVNESNLTLCLILRKHVKVMSSMIKLIIMNVVYLISWNPQGAHGGVSSMGFYTHIALCVTCKSTCEGYLCEALKCSMFL